MSVKVVQACDVKRQCFDTFLAKTNRTLLYYTLRYRDFLKELLDCETRYLVAIENENITGVFPLMLKNGPLGYVVNSLPFFGSNGGVLASTQAAEAALWDAYQKLICIPDVAAATVIFHPLGQQAPPPVRIDYEDVRVGQFTALDLGADAKAGLMTKIDGASRRNIRKAEKEGIEVSRDTGAIQLLEEIHRENMAAIGGRVKPSRFFKLLPQYFRSGKDYELYVARLNNEVVAALLIFFAGKTVEYFIPATRIEARNKQPSAAILCCAMVDAARRGYRWWNWGGTWLDQEGVLAFKRKWGAEDHRYHYFTTINNDDVYTRTSGWLMETYPYFYVLPFHALQGDS